MITAVCPKCHKSEFHLIFNGDTHVLCAHCNHCILSVSDVNPTERDTDTNTKVCVWD